MTIYCLYGKYTNDRLYIQTDLNRDFILNQSKEFKKLYPTGSCALFCYWMMCHECITKEISIEEIIF